MRTFISYYRERLAIHGRDVIAGNYFNKRKYETYTGNTEKNMFVKKHRIYVTNMSARQH